MADKDDLIGPLNQGWGVGKRLLQYERSVHGGVNTSGAQVEQKIQSLADIAKHYTGVDHNAGAARLADSALRSRLLTLEMNSRAYALTQQRIIAETQTSAPSTATSILKVKGAEFTKERAEVLQQVMGSQGFGWEAGNAFSAAEIEANRDWLTTRAVSIYGGTSEIQRNIIAKRVIGLPD